MVKLDPSLDVWTRLDSNVRFMYNQTCIISAFFSIYFIAGICLVVQLATFTLLLGCETTYLLTLVLPLAVRLDLLALPLSVRLALQTYCCELATLGCEAGSLGYVAVSYPWAVMLDFLVLPTDCWPFHVWAGI